jgi:serine protease Do
MSILSVAHLQGALADVAASLRAVTAVVARRGDRDAPGGHGSGIVWAQDGTIVTNAHVVPGRGSSGIEVTLADGRAAPARIVVRDPRRDLAILRMDRRAIGPAPLPLPTLGEPSSLRVGELLLALGHPFGMAHALAVGVVHAASDARRTPYLQADLRLAPGNSGGPLADARGRIVGVNSMIVNGLGVAISIDVVRALLADAARRAA